MTAVVPASQLFDLRGEVALVTGASSGLGARFAQVLAAHGAKVVIAARRLDRLEALQAEIGSAATAIALDVAKTETIPAAFDAAELAFGAVSLLINNAGVAEDSRFLDMSKEEWERVLRAVVWSQPVITPPGQARRSRNGGLESRVFVDLLKPMTTSVIPVTATPIR